MTYIKPVSDTFKKVTLTIGAIVLTAVLGLLTTLAFAARDDRIRLENRVTITEQTSQSNARRLERIELKLDQLIAIAARQ